MATTQLAPYLTQQFFANNGTFLTGGTVQTLAGGTNTPIATYVDNTGTTTNTNPIVLNARGECVIWLLPNVSYKFVVSDSAGNLIETRDNVVNAQLITYYGVDSGSANTYILTAATPYTTYQNGELVFFVPSQTNTGPSTVNINGLGPIPIVTITGAPVAAGQIVAGLMTEIIYFNGSFQLLSIGNTFGPSVGTFGAEIPIQSAATTDIGSTPNHNNLILGTVTINSFGASAQTVAPIYIMRFAQSLTLTFNATTMILPGNASIVTMAGDAAIFEYLGNASWKCLFYQSSGGQQNSKIKPSDTVLNNTATLTPDPDLITNTLATGSYSFELYLIFDSVTAGAGFKFTNDGSFTDSRAQDPALAYGFVNGAAYGPKADSFYATVVSFATVSTSLNGNQVMYKGSFLVGVAGTFGISWAQNSATGTNTTLRAGSYLNCTQLNTGATHGTAIRTYSTVGSFVETVPAGFTNVLIEVWGGSGGGGAGAGTPPSPPIQAGGGGAASGAYVRSTYSVAGLGGQTINLTVGSLGAGGSGPPNDGTAGGNSTVSSGSFSLTTMTATGGAQGLHAANSVTPGAAGIGGAATGGNVINTSGNSGSPGTHAGAFGNGGTGGGGIPGINNGGAPGGSGGDPSDLNLGNSGGVGVIVFQYS